jgi:K+-transporting ATPase ATPase C chain
MLQHLRPALTALLIFSLLTGIVYPLAVTGLAQVFFPRQANGELIVLDNKILGSKLIGQYFDDPKYFWSRPSATSPYPYNASDSSGSNLSQGNITLLNTAQYFLSKLKSSDPNNHFSVPVDLVTTSSSGLDPNISLAAAQYQVARVARLRGLSESSVNTLVQTYTKHRLLGFLGEPVVNVLELNLALDRIK